MGSMVHAGAVLNDEYLWGLMLHPESAGNVVGNVAVLKQIEQVSRYSGVVFPTRFEAAEDHRANGATRAVFKYDNSPMGFGLL